MNTRKQRFTENQRAFRVGNERLRRVLETTGAPESIPFLCECLDDTCLASIDLTLEEYEGIRAHENRFLIVRDHPTLADERIVTEADSHQIVEK